MGNFYEAANIPEELRRSFDVYDRIRELKMNLGTWEENVVSLSSAGIARVVFTEVGLVYLSGTPKGKYPMFDDDDVVRDGQLAGQEAADEHIRRLHWAITCGREGGDLNDVLYTIKAMGMVVSPSAGGFSRAPEVVNGYSFRWHSVFGGGRGEYARSGVDPGGFAGVHARSAIGGFGGKFSLEPEIIIAIPTPLAKAIISNRGWVFPLPPNMLEKVTRAKQNS